MLARKASIASAWLVVVILSIALSGCSKPAAPPPLEQPAPPLKAEALAPPPQTKEAPEPSQPKVEEVQEAVKRIFKDAVVIEANREPGFLVGDFNGDLSQDLAVIIKPADGKLSELNQQFPGWIAREPIKDILLPKSKVVATSASGRPLSNAASGQTVRFEQTDVLLAIIHGSGLNGWRDREATQTHLLRDVVGTNIRMLRLKGAAKAYKGIKPFPVIYGDLIQQTLIGQSGFLHFSGGVYGWYDPKNYKPVIVPGHSSLSAMSASSKSTNPNSTGIRR
ncbi:MAG: hypothetical protein WAV20_18545 [Blastocatellia bacterium]